MFVCCTISDWFEFCNSVAMFLGVECVSFVYCGLIIVDLAVYLLGFV